MDGAHRWRERQPLGYISHHHRRTETTEEHIGRGALTQGRRHFADLGRVGIRHGWQPDRDTDRDDTLHGKGLPKQCAHARRGLPAPRLRAAQGNQQPVVGDPRHDQRAVCCWQWRTRCHAEQPRQHRHGRHLVCGQRNELHHGTQALCGLRLGMDGLHCRKRAELRDILQEPLCGDQR